MPEMDQERMEFIKQVGIRLQAVHKKALKLIVRTLFRNEVVPDKDSSRIGVYDKGRLVPSVEQDAISSLRPDSVNRQQPLSQRRKVFTQEFVKVTVTLLKKELHKVLQPPSLYIVIPCGPDHRG